MEHIVMGLSKGKDIWQKTQTFNGDENFRWNSRQEVPDKNRQHGCWELGAWRADLKPWRLIQGSHNSLSTYLHIYIHMKKNYENPDTVSITEVPHWKFYLQQFPIKNNFQKYVSHPIFTHFTDAI